MEIRIGRKGTDTAAKEQVTAPARINPLGGLRSQPPTNRMQPAQLRAWADDSEWIRAAVNHRRRQVSQSEWRITPVDADADYDEQLQAAIELMFLHPNSRQKTFRELIEPAVEDILVLDRGVIEKEANVRGLPIALHLVDGATVRTKPGWGGEPNEPRYEWWPGSVFVANMLDSQVVLMMENPTSHRVNGFSPLEALKATIDADLEARDFNKRAVSQTNPNGILNLGENVGTNVVDAFRVYWDAEVAGNKQMAIVGGVKNMKFQGLGQTAREMQYMQWQVYLLRKIAAVFGIAPQDLGICYSDDTEVLTERGWLTHTEIDDQHDRIAVVDPDTNTVSFRLPEYWHRQTYDGPMRHFKSRSVDVLVTPKHGMYVRPYIEPARSAQTSAPYTDWSWQRHEAQSIPWDEFEVMVAAPSAAHDQEKWEIPTVDHYAGIRGGVAAVPGRARVAVITSTRVKMDDWLRFLGIFIAEGSVEGDQQGNRISVSQRKPENISTIRQIMNNLPLEVKETEFVPSEQCSPTSKAHTQWKVWDAALALWLRENVGHYSWERRIPSEFKRLSARQLRILLDGLLLGDGAKQKSKSTERWVYTTTSEQLANDVQEISVLCDMSATVTPVVAAENRRKHYAITITSRPVRMLRQRHNITSPWYTGTVFCPYVGNRPIITRRNMRIGVNYQTFDVNRANAQTQQELSEDRGLKPLLRLIEEQLNTKVLADFAQTKAKQLHAAGEIDMQTLRLAVALTHVNPRDHTDIFHKLHSANILNLAFKFRLRSAKSTRDQAEYNRNAVAGFPWRTINEVRAEDGFGPVGGGNAIVVMTPIGAMPLEMIGGQMEAQTEDQKRYLEGLFRAAPVVLGQGARDFTPVTASPSSKADKEVVYVPTEVVVDEDGEEVED